MLRTTSQILTSCGGVGFPVTCAVGCGPSAGRGVWADPGAMLRG